MASRLLIASLSAVAGLVGGAAIARYALPAIGGAPAAQAPVAAAEPAPATVEVARATQGRVDQALNSLGTLQARESVPLASLNPGVVTAIHFQEGTRVEANALLVELDQRIARANLASAETELRAAQVRFERSQQLSGSGFRSRQQLDDDRAAIDRAAAEVAVRQTQLAQLSVRAPFAGVLGQRDFGVGEYIEAGKRLVTLEDRSVLRVSFRVPERFLPKLAIGQSVELTLDAVPGRRFTGRVTLLDPRPGGNDRDIQVRAEIPNDAPMLPSGLFARIRLVIESRPDAIVVPPSAVSYMLTGAYVFKVVEGRARRVPVRVGLQFPDRVEILEGVAAGDQVVTAGQFNLDDGRRVTTVSQTPGQR
ncbi:efflux RND transporter periplasmic adaptor subunit [Falsiroseomonas sp.]|uniref:efflux RND transporter periplasmic adaptor subunit n=1 Tax=Falsiroseomonas sp. TaxID=2870721 RepID=UPI003F716D07